MRLKRSSQIGRIDFDSYHRTREINDYLGYLSATYPESVRVETIGQSYEGRDLKAILITNTTDGNATAARPLILVDAGIHAREWIAPAAALYIINQLVENATHYEKQLLAFDWLIWPIVNPDGYEYTHDYDRFWRKTRKPSSVQGASKCVGTDGNRNFDFHWGGAGTSGNGCSDIYKGPEPFSEPETRALRDLLFRVNKTCRLYLTLHSYGSYLLYPWGYDSTLPPTWKYLDAVAQAGADAMEAATGTVYEVGSSTHVLYAAAGASDDYAFGVANIPVSITMELPSGGSGFDPSASEIKSIAEETWIGIRAMAARTLEPNEFIDDAGKNGGSSLGQQSFWKTFF